MTGPVVLAYDGSSGADHAIRTAAALLTASAAIVVTAWEPLRDPYTGPIGDPMFVGPDIDPEVVSAVESAHAEQAAALAQHGARVAREAGFDQVSARPERGNGPTWRTILAVADDVGADAIVVGVRGLSAIKSALLGSVSHAVAQHAERPVLMVPQHDDRG